MPRRGATDWAGDWIACPVRKSRTLLLLAGLELGVDLRGEALRNSGVSVANLGVRLRNLGVEIGPGLRSDHVGLALAVFDHFRNAIPNRKHHVPMCNHGVPVNGGSMPRNDLRVRPRTRDDLAEPI